MHNIYAQRTRAYVNLKDEKNITKARGPWHNMLDVPLWLIGHRLQVTNRLEMPYIGDELHNSGWNACSSCYTDIGKTRHFLIFPALLSDRIYIIDTKDEKAPFIHKVPSAPLLTHARPVEVPLPRFVPV